MQTLRRTFLALLAGVSLVSSVAAEQGITDKSLRIASVLDLKGAGKDIGTGMEAGLSAALDGRTVQGRQIRLITKNDFGQPDKSVAEIDQLLQRNIFLFIGNTGAAPVQAGVGRLFAEGVPAFGFASGVEELRTGKGPAINFRPSVQQEVEAVVRSALQSGVEPKEICAYVENNAYGMMGVQGIKRVFQGVPEGAELIEPLDRVLTTADTDLLRNGQGPVGVYTPDTFVSRPGYRSLKEWEEKQGTACKLVVTVGTSGSIASFIGYARYKGEKWVISVVSSVGGSTLTKELRKFQDFERVSRRIILTQVVPLLDSPLPIMQEARAALGNRLSVSSAEGFIVGRLLREILDHMKGAITRDGLMQAASSLRMDLGGLPIDLRGDLQASDLVLLTTSVGAAWGPMTQAQWDEWKR